MNHNDVLTWLEARVKSLEAASRAYPDSPNTTEKIERAQRLVYYRRALDMLKLAGK